MQFDLGCNPFSTQFANYLFQVLVIGVGEKKCVPSSSPSHLFPTADLNIGTLKEAGDNSRLFFYGDNQMNRVKSYTKCSECGHKADVAAGDEYLCGKCWRLKDCYV